MEITDSFKPIPNYNRYYVSEYGEVYDTKFEKLMTPNINGGYKCLNLYRDDGKKVLEKVHRCVAYAYLTKPDNAENIVIHKTEDRFNNNVSNLEWKIKGVHHPMIKRYSHYCGVRYHITELEKMATEAGISLHTVRQRLEIGWTASEIHQGYKQSDCRTYDGLTFTNKYEFKRFVEMLDADNGRKDYYEKQCEWRQNKFMLEVKRNDILKKMKERYEVRGTDDPLLYEEARNRWRRIMRRCYGKEDPAYKFWGAVGATVCDEWHDLNVFCSWYIKNKIDGWDIEKDIVQLKSGGRLKQYSPENCCFVPKYMNLWFSTTKVFPNVKRNRTGYYLELGASTDIGVKRLHLKGDTEEDVREQYFLVKDLHLEKQVFRMKREWNKIKSLNTKTPEINTELISVLENFSTEKYLNDKMST